MKLDLAEFLNRNQNGDYYIFIVKFKIVNTRIKKFTGCLDPNAKISFSIAFEMLNDEV